MHTGRWPTAAEIVQVVYAIEDVKTRLAELDAKLEVVRDMTPPTVARLPDLVSLQPTTKSDG
jgi:hypothetical protein